MLLVYCVFCVYSPVSLLSIAKAPLCLSNPSIITSIVCRPINHSYLWCLCLSFPKLELRLKPEMVSLGNKVLPNRVSKNYLFKNYLLTALISSSTHHNYRYIICSHKLSHAIDLLSSYCNNRQKIKVLKSLFVEFPQCQKAVLTIIYLQCISCNSSNVQFKFKFIKNAMVEKYSKIRWSGLGNC